MSSYNLRFSADVSQIDLDTIETSNLNRQFLFRTRHVGSSKAAVAAEAVRRFAPQASIRPHQVSQADLINLLPPNLSLPPPRCLT